MTEYHFADMGHVGTREFHEYRERAPHWEQAAHRPRLVRAVEFVRQAVTATGLLPYVVDLGCGDGGLLAQLGDLTAWGYDFAPANQAGWRERGVQAAPLDVFADLNNPSIVWAPVVVVTEVLEHIDDPHGALRAIRRHGVRFVVASSPNGETPESHDACHQWGWDLEGYAKMFGECGWRVVRHEPADWSQVLLAERSR